jgi:hypothetical protein
MAAKKARSRWKCGGNKGKIVMVESEERITTLEKIVQSLSQRLDASEKFSLSMSEALAVSLAENAVLSRAITFLGMCLGQHPNLLPKGMLADVYGMVMSGLDDDVKAKATRAVTNLSFWKQ